MRRESGVTLAALRRATAVDHESVDELIDLDRLVEIGYHSAVVGELIEAAEIVEMTLPLIPHELCREKRSPSDVSLERLDLDETNAAVMAARAGFDVHRRSRSDHLPVGGDR
jgi:hypothetical protein